MKIEGAVTAMISEYRYPFKQNESEFTIIDFEYITNKSITFPLVFYCSEQHYRTDLWNRKFMGFSTNI